MSRISPSSGWWMRLHPLTWEVDSRVRASWVVRRATVSESGRYCYFRIPKCANSTLIKTLASFEAALADAADADGAQLKRRMGGLLRARAWSPGSLQRRYFCFTFVRNPYTRVLSAYLDKIAAADPSQYLYVARAAGVDRASEVSFGQFVSFLERGGLLANAHWAPQRALLPIAPARLDFVGRVESLDDDVRSLVSSLPGALSFKGLQVRADRRRGADARMATYYDDDLARRVYNLYREDFITFGYALTDAYPETAQ